MKGFLFKTTMVDSGTNGLKFVHTSLHQRPSVLPLRTDIELGHALLVISEAAAMRYKQRLEK